MYLKESDQQRRTTSVGFKTRSIFRFLSQASLFYLLHISGFATLLQEGGEVEAIASVLSQLWFSLTLSKTGFSFLANHLPCLHPLCTYWVYFDISQKQYL